MPVAAAEAAADAAATALAAADARALLPVGEAPLDATLEETELAAAIASSARRTASTRTRSSSLERGDRPPPRAGPPGEGAFFS